jgi:hypothetical protein
MGGLASSMRRYTPFRIRSPTVANVAASRLDEDGELDVIGSFTAGAEGLDCGFRPP